MTTRDQVVIDIFDVAQSSLRNWKGLNSGIQDESFVLNPLHQTDSYCLLIY